MRERSLKNNQSLSIGGVKPAKVGLKFQMNTDPSMFNQIGRFNSKKQMMKSFQVNLMDSQTTNAPEEVNDTKYNTRPDGFFSLDSNGPAQNQLDDYYPGFDENKPSHMIKPLSQQRPRLMKKMISNIEVANESPFEVPISFNTLDIQSIGKSSL